MTISRWESFNSSEISSGSTILLMLTDSSFENVEKIGILNNIRNGEIPILVNTSNFYITTEFRKIKQMMPSITVNCLGIGYKSVKSCNDICLYLQKSWSKCKKITGLGSDGGIEKAFSEYYVVILDEYQFNHNNSRGVEYIYASSYLECLPFDHSEEVCIGNLCYSFSINTISCGYDSLIYTYSVSFNTSMILVDTEGRTSYFNPSVLNFDRTVFGKITEWYNIGSSVSVLANEAIILDATLYGRSYVASNLSRLAFDYTSSDLWMLSNNSKSVIALTGNSVNYDINFMICNYFECPNGPLCFNTFCNVSHSINIDTRSNNYHVDYFNQFKLISLDVKPNNVVNLQFGGIGPFGIYMNNEILVFNNDSISDCVKIYDDGHYNFSCEGHYIASYLGFEVNVYVNNRRKREIDHIYHDQYRYNPALYYWWVGFPLEGVFNYRQRMRFNRFTGLFEYKDERGVVNQMKNDGVFSYGRDKDTVLLVHGWHAVQSSERLFKQLLRHHQKMTPNSSVIFVKWESQGANDIELGNAAFSAVRVNLENFLTELPDYTNLHCVGHSLGGHACGAICRHFRKIKGKNCTRIVSLDPASIPFKYNSPYQNEVGQYRIHSSDADYVALFMTNRNLMGLHHVIGHEYIMSYSEKEGYYHDACPLLGKWWGNICTTGYYGYTWCDDYDIGTMANSYIIPHTQDSCSHMMAPIQFIKFLDVWNPAIVATLTGNSLNRFRQTIWTSYVTSVDKRYNYDNTYWSSYRVHTNELNPYEILTFVIHKNDWNPSISAQANMRCNVYVDPFKICKYFIPFDNVRKSNKISVYTGFANIPRFARISRGEGIFVQSWKNDILKSGDFYEVPMTTDVRLYCKDTWCYQTNERINYPTARNSLQVNGKKIDFNHCPVNISVEFSDLNIMPVPTIYCFQYEECIIPFEHLKRQYSPPHINVIKYDEDFDDKWYMLYYYGFHCSNTPHVKFEIKAEIEIRLEFSEWGNKYFNIVFDFDKIELYIIVQKSRFHKLNLPKKPSPHINSIDHVISTSTNTNTKKLSTSATTILSPTITTNATTIPTIKLPMTTNATTNFAISTTTSTTTTTITTTTTTTTNTLPLTNATTNSTTTTTNTKLFSTNVTSIPSVSSSLIDSIDDDDKFDNNMIEDFTRLKVVGEAQIKSSVNGGTFTLILVISMILIAVVIVAFIKYKNRSPKSLTVVVEKINDVELIPINSNL